MTWIKICGLTTPDAVEAALGCGVDALGFVFHGASARNLEPAAAAALAQAVPARVRRVAVTRNPSQALLDAIWEGFRPDLLQTDLADLESLVLPAGLAVLPVLRPGVRGPARLPPRCLYDGAASGSGCISDWTAARRLGSRCELVLAGGLDPANVADAIRAVRPFGVDVSSGVESAPGRKDPARIAEFVAAARAAALSLQGEAPVESQR
jgi:phosphoribosylanthranilate isomerase